MDKKIPKVIHYCWFGGSPLPELATRCIQSWRMQCPEYKIIEWNESNFDLDSCPYVLEAYKEKKWAFVSDYARLRIIYEQGGIYLDTDVELIKSLNPLLELQCFLGTEPTGFINTGLGFGAIRNHPVIELLLGQYNNIHFDLGENEFDLTPCPIRNTIPIQKMGFEFSETKIWTRDNVSVFPPKYLCPMDNVTGTINIVSETLSIHHYSALWISEEEKKIKHQISDIEKTYIKPIAQIKKHLLLYKTMKREGKTRNLYFYIATKKREKKRRKMLLKNDNKPPVLVINSGYRWSYYHWFLLGFYILNNKGDIQLKFHLPLWSKVLSRSNNTMICCLADKCRRIFEKDDYNLRGYISFPNGQKKKFVIDSADAPYLFNAEDLNNSDIYFKMQCPIELNDEGFHLTPSITIPWLDHQHADERIKKITDRGERRKCVGFSRYKQKIKPLLNATRALTKNGFSEKKLTEGYNKYYQARKTNKKKSIMCYFGNSLGPKMEEYTEHPDFDWEADIMTYYGAMVSHPNEKRAYVADYIATIENCDARIITRNSADTGIKENKDLVVPLEDFCDFISEFEYNINVSGYRMSIPSRFIESFIVGTGIITDKLRVRWFLPFDEEVRQTVEMGYLPMNEVDWQSFKKDLSSIPKIDANKIIELYEKKWSPISVANYIIDTIKNS